MEGTFGSYLASLLTSKSEYRAKWDRPDRAFRGSGLNQAAVARTLMEHAAATGGETRSLTAWKTLVWRALGDRVCSDDFLDTLIEVFAIDESAGHERALRSLHRATFGDRAPMDPIPSMDWIPEEVRERLGTARCHRSLCTHDRHVIGVDRRPVMHRTTYVIEATRPGCDSYFFNTDTSHIDVEVPIGGDVVAVHEAPGGLRCTEIGFGREIPVGQSHVFEVITRFSPAIDLPAQVRRASGDRLRQVSIMVSFERDAIPRVVRWAEWESIAADIDPVVETEVDVDERGVVHRFVERAIHPVVGFSWEW